MALIPIGSSVGKDQGNVCKTEKKSEVDLHGDHDGKSAILGRNCRGGSLCDTASGFLEIFEIQRKKMIEFLEKL